MIRVPTVGTDPEFVAMIRELIEERLSDRNPVRRYPGRVRRQATTPAPVNCCQPRASVPHVGCGPHAERATA